MRSVPGAPRAPPRRRDLNDVWLRVGRDLDLEDERLDI